MPFLRSRLSVGQRGHLHLHLHLRPPFSLPLHLALVVHYRQLFGKGGCACERENGVVDEMLG